MERIIRLLLRTLTLLFAALAATISAAQGPMPRSVLVVSQWDPGLPFYSAWDSAFDATLHATASRPVSVYSEALDLSRFHAPKYQENFRRYLEEKYRDKDLGVVVAVGARALEFMLRIRSEQWSTVPLVFSTVDEATIAKLKLPADVTGTTMQLTLRDMVATARALVPKLQRVALVGEPWTGTSIYRNFKDELPQLAELEFIDLTGLSVAEIKKRVAVLPENTAILYTAIFVDGAGIAFAPTIALEAIASAANRPIVVNTETQLGHGSAGGLIIRPSPIGDDAARLTLRILNGESPASIPIVLGNYTKPMFDWRQLTRWGISESQLPSGSEIRFREPGIWEQYRWHVVTAFAIIALQLALITWLLVERRRRRMVEAKLLLRVGELAHLNRSATAGALSASIAHELNQPLGAILSSAEAAELYLNASPPNLDQVKTILGDIRRDDQHAADIIGHLRGLLKKNGENDLQKVDLKAAINDTVQFIGPEAIKRGVTLNTNFVEGVRPVRARQDSIATGPIEPGVEWDGRHGGLYSGHPQVIDWHRIGGSIRGRGIGVGFRAWHSQRQSEQSLRYFLYNQDGRHRSRIADLPNDH